jgi:N-acetyl-1-D-myo-inositol-2-amino-2-deoxy-alpha-D-glucopyranoside deacetylase
MPGGLLTIYAHPDDETLCSGTMAHYVAAGVPVTTVCATRGEVGEIAPGTGATPETLGEFRERELREAMAILGVADVRFLGFRDSGMAGTPENDDPRSLNRAPADRVVEPLVRIIREVRPAVIATWDASGGYGHPDHMAVHQHATAAYHAAADASLFQGLGTPHRARALYYSVIPVEEFARLREQLIARGIDIGSPGDEDEAFADLPRVPANCRIDVTSVFEKKQAALFAHKTQLNESSIFGGLPDDLARQLFGTEFYHRADPPLPDGTMLDDLLAGID